MSALEQEIVDKFYQLDAESQQRVLRQLNEPESTSQFDWESWFAELDALAEIRRARQGSLPQIDVAALVREVREEEE